MYYQILKLKKERIEMYRALDQTEEVKINHACACQSKSDCYREQSPKIAILMFSFLMCLMPLFSLGSVITLDALLLLKSYTKQTRSCLLLCKYNLARFQHVSKVTVKGFEFEHFFFGIVQSDQGPLERTGEFLYSVTALS